ncbi:hypothetical protein FT663_03963 [Candidozyma haemuli var. vulneris]|uniref:Ino eighty subunit 1 n=1 Tax=Candidozyma haemuli TaxID=45357 RepID=A0A2V1AV56_9ASCO|nr:hypothetical protein CXQ85_000694 [[Candida] haemuloni]KAF3987402.1 hypothetical protein FT662_04017 [[Candida] haemuloni var. vulneris]KAF3988607.1 hypothetical protein FT663_03963 [[Candida] haemuloni var. vulneris]PVH21705.1 hypothetical protein CXQ85_000694 [[Candida] haemuloni]
MNYDPIHDTYSAPEQPSQPASGASPQQHEDKPESGAQGQEQNPEPAKDSDSGNAAKAPAQTPAQTSESENQHSSPPQTRGAWNPEPSARHEQHPPQPAVAPYKPFSIDSLMGGSEPAEPPQFQRTELPKIDFQRTEPPRPEFQRTEPPRPEIHRNDPPRPDFQRTEPPREVQSHELPRPEPVQRPEVPAQHTSVNYPPVHQNVQPQASEGKYDPARPLPPIDGRLGGDQAPPPEHKSAPEHKPAPEPVKEESAGSPTETAPAYSPEQGQLPSDFREISRGYKYLKKADGEPFWRKDIQYDFLHELFTDETRCFTNYFPYCEVTNAANGPKLTFSELYVRTLAESNKSSKILRERLIKEKDMGVAVSKVCLLVNAGRMNTTVNFVPDMRSALRTYHSIPSLQTSGSGDSRPLQDTPRLKTILKAVCDDQKHLLTLLDLFKNRNTKRPNTNVIKLIFLMSTFFQNIPFHYDDSYEHDSFSEKFRFIKASPGPQNKFMEFFLNDEIHPKCRSRRFLWLMYTYLETNFTPEEVAENPFNPHAIPPLEYIPEAELPNYDVDADFEVEYAIKMYHTRMMHLSADAHNPLPKKGNKSRRERQKIQHQLNDGSSTTPAPYAEEQDDSMNVDDTTIVHQEEPVEPVKQVKPEPPAAPEVPEPPVQQPVVAESSSTSSGSQGNDKAPAEKVHKRKRPAPSVGSLVEDTRKPVLAEERQRLTTPEFPIEGLQELRERYAITTPANLYKPLSKEGPLSAAGRKEVASKSKPTVDLVSKTLPRKFESTKEKMLRWLHDYFEYRRATGSGLVGIEWEDIRSDVSNGIEAYVYQQEGKQHLIQKYEKVRDDDEFDVEIKRETFSNGPNLGDSAPVDIGAVENYGAGYEPDRDFNKVNERRVFELGLLELLHEAIAKKKSKRPKFSRISFDLDNGTLSF